MEWGNLWWLVIGAGLVVLLVYAITLYNQLVSVKHGVTQAWSNIDVLLRQRHEELPKLVEACRQYMQYEQATLERVISARNAVGQARDRRSEEHTSELQSRPHLVCRLLLEK